MRLRDVMEAPETIDAETSVENALAMSSGAFIVLSGKTVMGVVSDHDLRAVPAAERSTTRVGTVSRIVPSLAPDTTIKHAANVLRSRGAECVPVLQENRLVGSFSVARLLELVGRGALHVNEDDGRTILHSRGPGHHQRQPPV